jgi:hypothetical protein
MRATWTRMKMMTWYETHGGDDQIVADNLAGDDSDLP